MTETTDNTLVEGLDRIDAISGKFGELALEQIACLGSFLDYRPGPDALSETLLVFYFDHPVEASRATGKLSVVEWQFEGEIYARGYDRKAMQRNLAEMTLGIERIVRKDPNLGRTVKLGRVEFGRGYTVGRVTETDVYLVKRFRFFCQSEQAGIL